MARSPAKKQNGNGANLGFEAQLWATADKLRGNMEPSDYKHVALSQSLTVPSRPPEATWRPSGVTAIAVTPPGWPSNERISNPGSPRLSVASLNSPKPQITRVPMTLTRVSQDTIQSFRDGTGSNHSDSDRIFHAGRRWRDESTAVAMKRRSLAKRRLIRRF